MKIIAGVIGGFVFATLTVILMAATLGAQGARISMAGINFVVLLGCAIYVAVKSPSAALAWRELLLTSAILAFLLPISGMIFTGGFMASHLDTKSSAFAAQAAGAMIGGGIFTAMLGFFGWFVGVALLVPGLLIGRSEKRTPDNDSDLNVLDESQPKKSLFSKSQPPAKCPHCGGIVAPNQQGCNHCLNQISWINGKALRPSRPA